MKTPLDIIGTQMEVINKGLKPKGQNLSMILGLKTVLEEIQGQWNGDNSGLLEDRAVMAGEALEKLGELDELLEELEIN